MRVMTSLSVIAREAGIPYSGGSVSKRRERDNRSAKDSALVGAGAVATTGGLLASGIPGQKPQYKRIGDISSAPTRPAKAKALWDTGKGGIFGYRYEAHKDATKKIAAEHRKMARWDLANDPNVPEANAKEFHRKRLLGKIKSEKRVMDHLKAGRKIGYGVTGAGLAAVGTGVVRSRLADKRERDARLLGVRKDEKASDRFNGGALGVGASLGLGGYASQKAMLGQRARWMHESRQLEGKIDAINPHLKDAGKPRPDPKLNVKLKPGGYDTGHIMDTNNHGYMRDMTNKQSAELGRLHGQRSQARYFGRVYGQNAKYAGYAKFGGAGLAAIGAGSIAASRKERRKKRTS